MKNKMDLQGKTALITGAGSGIGRGIARALAQRGCHLILADINEAGLQETKQICAANGVPISLNRLDVTNRAAIRAFAPGVEKLDLLINNAGVALGGTFEQTSEEDFDWLMSINFYGVVQMCRSFLPLLRKSGDARIVNISSLFGLVAPAGQSAYSASKFAVRGFSQALAHELEGSTIGVTVVHPGGIATSIAKNARVSQAIEKSVLAGDLRRIEKLLTLSPDTAGEIIVKAIERRQKRILVGRDAKVVAILERILPVGYWALMKRLLPS